MFLTVLTCGRLFVPVTNPLRGPRSSFVDGGYSGNLPLGERIGDWWHLGHSSVTVRGEQSKLGYRRLASKRSVRRGSGAPDADGPGACLSQPLGVGVDSLVFIHLMKDYKLKQRNLRASHTLGWSWNWNT